MQNIPDNKSAVKELQVLIGMKGLSEQLESIKKLEKIPELITRIQSDNLSAIEAMTIY